MTSARRDWLGDIAALALVLGLLLGGCGVPSTRIEEPTPPGDPTAVSTATNDPLPVTTPDPETLVQTGCPRVFWGPQPHYVTVSALQVSIPERDVSDDFPSELMPNNEPNAPYRVSLTANEAEQVGAFRPSPAVNPLLDTEYGVQICNQTGATHTISSLSVNIADFTPSSGPVTVWHICQGGPYNPATKASTPGCGGDGFAFVDGMVATLSADRTGATARAVAAPPPTGESQYRGANLPITLKPHQALDFLIAVGGLTSQGTYSLSFSVSIDGSPPAKISPSDGSFLIAPAAIVWTGTTCQTPAMEALIPPSPEDAFYVCPPSA